MDFIEAFLLLLSEAHRQGFTVTRTLIASTDGEHVIPGFVIARGDDPDDAVVMVVGAPTNLTDWWSLVAALVALGLEWPPLRERN